MTAVTSARPWVPADREFRRFSADEYQRMIDAGILTAADGVELAEGLVVYQRPPWGHTTPVCDQYRFSVEQYHRLGDIGIVFSGDKIELLEGLLVRKMTINPPHATSLQRTRKRIEALLASGWTARIQQPITLATSEPEPDVAVARGDDDVYAARHPTPGDLGLVVEVSESTLATDRRKVVTYGEAGVPEYWIVNLVDGRVEVYTGPQAGGYANAQTLQPGQGVALSLDGNALGTIAVNDLLP